MTIFILEIPHIADRIVLSLSATDCWNSLMVNRAWYNALIPYLWRDVVTFRTPRHRHEDHRKWTYVNRFKTKASRQALRRNAHHIRSLSCRGRDLLLLLVESGCTQLNEIYYMIEDEEKNQEDESNASTQARELASSSALSVHGLEELALLVACNPCLRAISIDSVFDSLLQQTDPALMRFVRALHNRPSVTSLHIGLRDEIRGPNETSTLCEILQQRLDLIDSKDVHTLELRRRGCRGSDRGLAPFGGIGGVHWPGRRSWGEPRNIGRCFDDSLVILMNDGILEITLPLPAMLLSVLTLLERYPATHSLHMDNIYESDSARIMQGIPRKLPNLKKLDMAFYGVYGDSLSDLALLFQDPLHQLSEVRFRGLGPFWYESAVRPVLLSASSLHSPHSLCNTLTELSFVEGSVGDGRFDIRLLVEVLASCPHLQDLDVSCVDPCEVVYQNPGPSPPWVCKLQHLSLNFEMWDNPEIPADFAMSFMEQLGAQTDLISLSLYFDDGDYGLCDLSFFQLTLDPKNGLGALSRLVNLRDFFAVGLVLPRMGMEEWAWMYAHWPSLRTLTLPVHGVGDAWLIGSTDEIVLEQGQRAWLSHLQVRARCGWSAAISLWGDGGRDN